MTAFCGREGKIHLFFTEKQSNNQKKWSSDRIEKAGQNTSVFLKIRGFQNDFSGNAPVFVEFFRRKENFFGKYLYLTAGGIRG